MTMNIYINATNAKLLAQESNKSGLINRLLAQHYDHDHTTPVVAPVAAIADRFHQGLCKLHGLPLDNRGRCLQKDCKYS